MSATAIKYDGMMTLNAHERAEWSRCAQAMYARGMSANGHALSAAVANGTITIRNFDRCASMYRAWLVFDEPKVNA